MEEKLDLNALVDAKDRTLLVAGLQALWRERVAARNSMESVASINGQPLANDAMFGIDEVAAMLRRVGAAPASF